MARGFTMDDFDTSQSRTHPVRGGRQGEAEKQLKAEAAPEEPCHHRETSRGLSVEPAVLTTFFPLLRRKSSRCLKEDGLSSQLVLESGWADLKAEPARVWRVNVPRCEMTMVGYTSNLYAYTQILSNLTHLKTWHVGHPERFKNSLQKTVTSYMLSL